MFAAVGLLVGLVLGSGLLAVSRRAASPDEVQRWPPWTALALGAAAASLFLLGVAGLIDTAFAVVPAIALPAAGVLFGAGRLVFGDRRWQSWLGLVLAALPALFWVAFAVGELLGPKH
jgi:4-amino-4-deoxy-L-arabinose transferase-like glycosyltransferase